MEKPPIRDRLIHAKDRLGKLIFNNLQGIDLAVSTYPPAQLERSLQPTEEIDVNAIREASEENIIRGYN